MPIPTRGFPEDYSGELLGHNSRNKPPFKPEDFQPEKSIEKEPTPETEPEKFKFNWVAFIVMVVLIGLTLFVGMIFPGLLDEYIAIVIINLIYGFAQAHGLKIKKISKK